MFTFMRNFLGVKTDQAVQAGVEALVRWDPQAATEAELRSMEQHLDELGLQVAQARAAYDRERKEAVAIKALLQQRMAAAEQLEKQRSHRAHCRAQGCPGEEPGNPGGYVRADDP